MIMFVLYRKVDSSGHNWHWIYITCSFRRWWVNIISSFGLSHFLTLHILRS